MTEETPEAPEAPKAPAPETPSPRRSPLRDLLYLGIVVVAYLLGLELIGRLPGPLATWSRLTLPNLWLLGASAVLLRGRDQRIALTRGGRRAWILAAVCAVMTILVVLAAVVWAPGYPVARPGAAGPALASLLIVLLVPAAEELFFRGLMLDHLVQSTNRPVAALLVSALFGMLHHLQGLALPMACLSLALCGAALATWSVLWAAALHVGWNALAQLRRAPLAGPGRWAVAGLAVAAILASILRGLATRDRART